MYLWFMKKRKQLDGILPIIKDKGLRFDFFLKEIGVSRSHFYFIRQGERKLTDDKKKKINDILQTNY